MRLRAPFVALVVAATVAAQVPAAAFAASSGTSSTTSAVISTGSSSPTPGFSPSTTPIALGHVAPAQPNPPAGSGCTSCTLFQGQTDSASPTYRAPVVGTITSWSVQGPSDTCPLCTVRLRIFREGDPGVFLTVAETPVEVVGTGLNTYTANISVNAGDVLGIEATNGIRWYASGLSGDAVYFVDGDPAPGSLTTQCGTPSVPNCWFTGAPGNLVNVAATLVPTITIGALAPPQPNPPAGNDCTNCTLFQGSTDAKTRTYAAPLDATITSWAVQGPTDTCPGCTVRLRIFRQTGTNAFLTVAETPVETVTAGLNTYAASIPVRAGDILGIDATNGIRWFPTGLAGDVVTFVSGDPAAGATTLGPCSSGVQNPCWFLGAAGNAVNVEATLVPMTSVSGTAQCTFNNNGTPRTYVLANARVDVYSGSTLLAPPSPVYAASDGTFTVIGLAAGAQYRFVFTGQVTTFNGDVSQTTNVSCSADGSTNVVGGLTLGTPSTIRNLRNHTWLTAYDLTADPLHIVTTDAFGALVIDDRLFKQGQSNWFKIAIKPGERLVANLRNLPADYSLAMYKDLLALFKATLTGSLQDVNRLTAAMSPDELSPDELSPDELSPDELSPDELSPDELSPDELSPDELSPDELSPDELSPDELSPDELSPDELSPDELSPDELSADGYSSVQIRGLLGVSAHAGTSPELIARHTWDNTGNFYLRVRPAAIPNATVDADHDFQLSARVIPSDCTNVTLSKTAPTTTGTPGVRTLFVTHTGRLPGLRDATGALTAAGTDYLSRVNAFATSVGNAAVVDLYNDAGINANYAIWDTARTCAPAANIVADSIHDLIAKFRGPSPSPLAYVVILGGDLVIPAHLVPDQAGLGNERSFSPPVLDDSASKASLAEGYFESYDFYASFDPISRYDHDLYLPDRGTSVGVLVESAADILKALDAYTAAGGSVRPSSGLVTGYDFLSYVANDAKSQLNASGVSTTGHELIEAPGLGPLDLTAWTADSLRAQLFGTQRYGIIDWNAHFSANRMLAADSTTRLLSSEIANVTDGRFAGTFVLSSGCHVGYNIQDADAITGVTQPVSFPEALLAQGATLVGSTGYGYHDTFTPKYTGHLSQLLLTELRYGTGAVPTGLALSNAKRDYVSELAALRGIDEKALGELTLYGLPFFGVDLPSGRLARAAAGTVTPTPSTRTAGLATYDLTPTYTLTRHDDALAVVGGGTETVSYFDAKTSPTSAPDVSTTPGQPILPRVVTGVAASGYAARGAVLLSGDYADVAPFRPRVDVATTEVRGVQPEYVSSVRAPVLPFALNNFDSATLVALPMQYVSSQGPSGLLGTGTARRFDNETVRVVYSSLIGAAADAGAPVLYGVTLTAVGTQVHVDVTAGALSSVGIDSILATYTAVPGTSSLYGHFRSIVLSAGPHTVGGNGGFFAHFTGDIETSGTGASPSDVRVLIQAIGGNGLVSYRTGQGNLLSITTDTATATAPKTTTSLALTAPSSALYGDLLAVSAKLTTADGLPVAGKTISFKLEGARAKATTDATGTASTSLRVGVYPSAAPYQIEASFAEDASDLASGASQDVLVTKAASSFVPVAPLTVQYSDPLVVATLDSASGTLVGRPVVITLSDGRAVGLLTDGYGRVIFDTLDFGGLGAGTYHATLTFGGDEGHLAAQPASIDVTVVPENASFTSLTLPPQATGAVTLTAQIAQEIDNAAGDLTRGTVTFTVRSDASTIVATASVHPSASGLATATVNLAPGVYSVDAALDNVYFAGTTSTALLAVYDTSVFTTGGGYVATTSTSAGFASGKKVNFGFNVKYQSGSTIPTGSVLVQLKDSNMTFRASTFSWMVIDSVTGGKRATYEGTGTVNGVSGYSFRVTAQDLVPDTFEIRIWDATSSFNAPLYSVSGPVSGGSITIH
ncbi:MAG TPA: hypothetical protein VI814_11645 [Candidatus Limnocylindria bacterium]